MRLAPFLFLLLVAPLLTAQSRAPAAKFSIKLERIPGYGTFGPWYSVTILGNGIVRFEGRTTVQVKGVRKKTIPVSEINELIQKLRDEDFFHWEGTADLCVDYPQVTITARLNDKRKQIVEGCETPGKVLALADEIDRIADVQSWVGNVRDQLIRQNEHSIEHASQ